MVLVEPKNFFSGQIKGKLRHLREISISEKELNSFAIRANHSSSLGRYITLLHIENTGLDTAAKKVAFKSQGARTKNSGFRSLWDCWL
ncbi:unnamed protein product [Blepharisma stoltei]|uniref:Uncharacterized protein n=1 Tax=Blepharisma stoltei TaxID=1481888 RepID=A0AAU9JXS1_9CILI|nr:unnamed protein product [Blepharisma stoltei]